MEIVTDVSAARKSSGLYQQETADILEVSLPTFRKIEANTDLVSIGHIKKLAPHLNDTSKKILSDMLHEVDKKFLATG